MNTNYFISEMTFNQAIIDELSEMENKIKFHMEMIENAFDLMEEKVSNWNTDRREILKSETGKALKLLCEQDTVRFKSLQEA